MKTKTNKHLAAWLSDPRAAEYFSGGYLVKMAVLAAVLQGKPMSDVVKSYNITRQAASKQRVRLRRIFGL